MNYFVGVLFSFNFFSDVNHYFCEIIFAFFFDVKRRLLEKSNLYI